MARATDGMEVFVRWRGSGLACEARDAGETQAASGGDQLAFGKEPLLDENQERGRIALREVPPGDAVARCDGDWICTAAGPQITFRDRLSRKKSPGDSEEAEVDPRSAKDKR